MIHDVGGSLIYRNDEVFQWITCDSANNKVGGVICMGKGGRIRGRVRETRRERCMVSGDKESGLMVACREGNTR
jgi:hypothetical protein